MLHPFYYPSESLDSGTQSAIIHYAGQDLSISQQNSVSQQSHESQIEIPTTALSQVADTEQSAMHPHTNQHYQQPAGMPKDQAYDQQHRYYQPPQPIQSQAHLQGVPYASHMVYSTPQGQIQQLSQIPQFYQPQYQLYDSIPVQNYMIPSLQILPLQQPSITNQSPLPQLQQPTANSQSSLAVFSHQDASQLSQPLSHLLHLQNQPYVQLGVPMSQYKPQQHHLMMSLMQQPQISLSLTLVPSLLQLASQQPQHSSLGVVSASNIAERLQQLLPVPPLAQSQMRPEANPPQSSQKRSKRKSKFTKAQDDLIVSLKKKGKSWAEIGELSGVGSYLAARNRYQVIVGQQGNNNSSSWNAEDKSLLRRMLDAGEMEKWRFIAAELNKATIKSYTAQECREIVRQLFWSDPLSFGVSEDTIKEVLKEKRITEKIIDQEQSGQCLSSVQTQNQSQSHQSHVPLQLCLMGSGQNPRTTSQSSSLVDDKRSISISGGSNSQQALDQQDQSQQQTLPHLAPHLLPHIQSGVQELQEPNARGSFMNSLSSGMPLYGHQEMDNNTSSTLPLLNGNDSSTDDQRANTVSGQSAMNSRVYKGLY